MFVLQRDERSFITLSALLAAVGAGLVIATQPPTSIVILLGAVIFGLSALITPLSLLVVLLILAPLRTLIATEAAYPLPLDIGQLVFFALAGVWIMTQIATRRRVIRFIWTPLYLPLIVFIAVTGLSGFNAFSVGIWLTEWLKWVLVLGLVVIILNTPHHSEYLVFGLVLAGVTNALIGIYIFFGGSGALHLLINDRFFRAFGTFGQPNPFGGFMGMLAPVALAAAYGYLLVLLRGYRQMQRFSLFILSLVAFYGVAGGIITLGVFTSWSRGAWLGFGASMLVLILLLPRKLWQGVALVGILALCGLFVWSTGRLPASITDRITSATQELFVLTDVRAVDITPENYAIVERLSHWQAALNMAQEHPWLGVGFGNYAAAYDTYRLLNWREALGHAHNYYLNVLAEAGIMGLLAYLALFLFIVAVAWQVRKHPDHLARAIGMGLIGTMAYLSLHSLTDNLYVNNIFMHFGVMLGLLAALHLSIKGQNWEQSKTTYDAFGIR